MTTCLVTAAQGGASAPRAVCTAHYFFNVFTHKGLALTHLTKCP